MQSLSPDGKLFTHGRNVFEEVKEEKSFLAKGQTCKRLTRYGACAEAGC